MYLEASNGTNSIRNVFLILFIKYRKIKTYFKPGRIYLFYQVVCIPPISDEWSMILQRHDNPIFFSDFCSFLKTFFHIAIPVEPCGIRILSHESVKRIPMSKIISSYPLMNGNTRPCGK